jgi:hypothetical protein
MSKSFSAAGMYVVFGAALVLATYPAWRFWLLGVKPTLDDLLQLRCLAF